MLTKDKIILVHYINVEGKSRSKAAAMIASVIKRYSEFQDDSVLMYWVASTENRVDCINPKILSELEYQKVLQKLETADEILKVHLENFDNLLE